MKTLELIAALEKLGTAYTGKDKTKPADPIVKLVAFLQKRSEETVEDLVLALSTPKKTAPRKAADSEPSAASRTYIEQLNKPGLNQEEFERLFVGIKTLMKSPLVQVAQGYSPKSKINTKDKALAAIREEFFRRGREKDKARQDRDSLLM